MLDSAEHDKPLQHLDTLCFAGLINAGSEQQLRFRPPPGHRQRPRQLCNRLQPLIAMGDHVSKDQNQRAPLAHALQQKHQKSSSSVSLSGRPCSDWIHLAIATARSGRTIERATADRSN